MVTVKRTMASDTVYRAGYHRAPARAYLRAMGLTDDDISRPIVAVGSAWNEATPCNVHLTGMAGGDNSLPGLLMAMARLNVPSVFLYGGTIKPGRYQGKDVTIQDVFEGVGAVEAGRMSEQELYDLECAACPGEGSCGGMYTANTMACASEALGMALPYSASIPAADPRREELCRATGETALQLLEAGLKPRDILTKKAFENALGVVVAVGGYT